MGMKGWRAAMVLAVYGRPLTNRPDGVGDQATVAAQACTVRFREGAGCACHACDTMPVRWPTG